MKAEFKLHGLYEAVIVLTPGTPEERILLAAFIRYDSNTFTAYVERLEDGHIQTVELRVNQEE